MQLEIEADADKSGSWGGKRVQLSYRLFSGQKIVAKARFLAFCVCKSLAL